MLKIILCLVEYIRIWFIGSIDESLLILIWGEGFLPHKPTLSSLFIWKYGQLKLNSTWYDQFICNQSYKTIIICIYRREALSEIFQPKSYYSIYQNLLDQEYQFLFNSIIKNDYFQYSSSKTEPKEYYHQFSSISFTIRLLSVSQKKKNQE